MQTNSRTSEKDLLIFRSAAKGKCFVNNWKSGKSWKTEKQLL